MALLRAPAAICYKLSKMASVAPAAKKHPCFFMIRSNYVLITGCSMVIKGHGHESVQESTAEKLATMHE